GAGAVGTGGCGRACTIGVPDGAVREMTGAITGGAGEVPSTESVCVRCVAAKTGRCGGPGGPPGTRGALGGGNGTAGGGAACIAGACAGAGGAGAAWTGGGAAFAVSRAMIAFFTLSRSAWVSKG